MTDWDKLDATLSSSEIEAAMARARQLRSEEAARIFKAIVSFFTIGKRKPVVTENGVTCAI
ncbi:MULTISPECIES: RSP_7527 family protein [Curvivirga]|uniref:RSP_7527 family protein n=1 Tax=Curvivirga TaxID=2856846 RepID=UPI0012BBA95F|nr:hypothetical protein [Curvivirga aplysinae]MTI09019.1 hypothetical protein [Curvivirga aplysinae]